MNLSTAHEQTVIAILRKQLREAYQRRDEVAAEAIQAELNRMERKAA